jgi:hypothetical protein
MSDFIFGQKGGIVIFLFFYFAVLLMRVIDCKNQKRNIVISFLVSLLILTLNVIVISILFYIFGYFAGYLMSLYLFPFYLQFFYFIFCVVGGLYIFSKFYLFLNKFYLNYLEKGVYSFNRKSGTPYK